MIRTIKILAVVVGLVTLSVFSLIGNLLAEGKLAPVIEQRGPPSEVPVAIECPEEGRAGGQVVILVQ
ncbi:MAG TPA: hypothetical protein VKB41_06415 [Steroidobacteraceae bacterium]|jgi:hypothetical protein|nr:hypothetical protein [Steroidobacteraceae bacterium]